jgi:endonuclease/exonuclease/phosphatase family metal-dependent hydrolase
MKDEDPISKPRKKAARPPQLRRWLRLNLMLCFLSLGLYYASTIRPETFWIFGFLGFLIPPALVANLFFIGFWLAKKPLFLLFSLLTLLLGIRFVQASFGFHFLKTESCGPLKVLSINAKTFGGMDKDKQKENQICTAMIKQFLEHKADVICIQEMFDNPRSQTFNVLKRLKKAGYRYIHFSKTGTMRWGASVGVATCSRYPIISKSIIRKKEGSNNQIIRTKIDVEGRHMIVVNMHLQSIFIREDELDFTEKSSGLWHKFQGVLAKMKVAYQARTRQIDLLLASTLDEELPVLICGDMNDTPYSNAYLRLRDSYNNAFEEKGSGFGFTYNGKIPFLRIDHQFSNSRLLVKRFEVDKAIKGSDHFGTVACYELVEN